VTGAWKLTGPHRLGSAAGARSHFTPSALFWRAFGNTGIGDFCSSGFFGQTTAAQIRVANLRKPLSKLS